MLHSVRNNEGYDSCECITVPSLMCYVILTFIGPIVVIHQNINLFHTRFLLVREEINRRNHTATMGELGYTPSGNALNLGLLYSIQRHLNCNIVSRLEKH